MAALCRTGAEDHAWMVAQGWALAYAQYSTAQRPPQAVPSLRTLGSILYPSSLVRISSAASRACSATMVPQLRSAVRVQIHRRAPPRLGNGALREARHGMEKAIAALSASFWIFRKRALLDQGSMPWP
jgi:hypothetical protein